MKPNELISKHLSLDQQYIKKNNKPLSELSELYSILEWWRKLSRSNTIGDLKLFTGNTAIIGIVINNKTYFINADTTRKGVNEFLKNKNTALITINNNNGITNKVTNNPNMAAIEGFYMYKVNF